MTDRLDAAPGNVARDHGFVMPFKITVKPLSLDFERVESLLEQFRSLVELKTEPPGRAGCEDCAKLDGLVALMKGVSSQPGAENNGTTSR